MDAKGKMRVRGPIMVRPATMAWLMSSQPSPSVTCGPTMQYGPIFTPSPRSAPDSTMAVGWICASAILARKGLRLRGVDDHGADLRLGGNLSIDLRLAEETPGTAAAANLAHVEAKLITRHHGPAELRLVDAHE